MAKPEPLSSDRVAELLKRFPDLPQDYIAYLTEVGCGEAPSGHMIYDGPVFPDEVYGPRPIKEDVLLLGDDFQGYCLAWNRAERRYGELSDDGDWEPGPPDADIWFYIRSEA